MIEELGTENWLPRTVGGEFAWMWMSELLVRNDEKTLKIMPNLAESWTVAARPDGTVDWSFKLRPGVAYHGNWGEVVASDVRFTLLEYLKPGSVASATSRYIGWFGKDPKNIEIKGKYEFNVHAPTADAGLWDQLSDLKVSGFAPIPESYLAQVGEDGFNRHPISTGPWEFSEQRRGQFIKFKAFTKNFRRVPGFQGLTVFKVQEPATQLAMMRTGAADIVRIEPKLKREFEVANIRLVQSAATTETFVIFGGLVLPSRPKYDPTVPWAGNNPVDEKPRMVRQAMNLAVDKKAILDKVLFGEGILSSVTFNFVPGTGYFNPDWKPYEYNPKKAKELLVQAGYPNGFTAKFWALTGLNTDVAIAIAASLEEIGIKTESTLVDFRPTIRQKLVERSTAGYLYNYKQSSVVNPLAYGGGVGGPSQNAVVHTESEFQDRLYAKISVEVDEAKRNQLIRELGDEYYRQYWTIPIALGNTLYAVSGKVAGWEPFPQISSLTQLEYAMPAK